MTIKLNVVQASSLGKDDFWEMINEDVGYDARKPAYPNAFELITRLMLKLEDNAAFQAVTINPDDSITQGSCNTIDIVLCSRDQYDALLPHQVSSLGLFSVDNMDENNLYNETTPHAQSYRVYVALDGGDLSNHIKEEMRGDREPGHFFFEYISAYLNTVFHEIEHAKLFMENARFNSPSDIESAYEAGDFNADLSDCASGYGIRDLEINEQAIEAKDAMHAAELMEEYVEEQGKHRLNNVVSYDDAEAFAVAMNIDEDLRHFFELPDSVIISATSTLKV